MKKIKTLLISLAGASAATLPLIAIACQDKDSTEKKQQQEAIKNATANAQLAAEIKTSEIYPSSLKEKNLTLQLQQNDLFNVKLISLDKDDVKGKVIIKYELKSKKFADISETKELELSNFKSLNKLVDSLSGEVKNQNTTTIDDAVQLINQDSKNLIVKGLEQGISFQITKPAVKTNVADKEVIKVSIAIFKANNPELKSKETELQISNFYIGKIEDIKKTIAIKAINDYSKTLSLAVENKETKLISDLTHDEIKLISSSDAEIQNKYTTQIKEFRAKADTTTLEVVIEITKTGTEIHSEFVLELPGFAAKKSESEIINDKNDADLQTNLNDLKVEIPEKAKLYPSRVTVENIKFSGYNSEKYLAKVLGITPKYSAVNFKGILTKQTSQVIVNVELSLISNPQIKESKQYIIDKLKVIPSVSTKTVSLLNTYPLKSTEREGIRSEDPKNASLHFETPVLNLMKAPSKYVYVSAEAPEIDKKDPYFVYKTSLKDLRNMIVSKMFNPAGPEKIHTFHMNVIQSMQLYVSRIIYTIDRQILSKEPIEEYYTLINGPKVTITSTTNPANYAENINKYIYMKENLKNNGNV
ncbi:hypothetical protein [Mycoplasma seminis]|uniref:Variable surface lipoprotein n=1 Tax=Mycoplasma seminis TaxID=512749 RepID=A0ABY9HBP6_9MOLU|nr:hypothetical protein [Mycoplasma seminis]WLP85783.1 hypothetical protein Q8852_01385 [Mycoplasma seminis]